jgi:hypothetical protein
MGNAQDWEAFNDYWYRGEAELTSYELAQSRYGEVHEGHAVLVFVTEPFSESKQVKLDNPSDEDKISVLKLNFSKKFLTGIYPYSMMMSSFVPVSYDKYPDALKVTTTSQEWCGHTFTQLNLQEKEYRFRQFSYFQREGDVDIEIKNTWLEDELWQRIRINPNTLPRGEINVLPGTLFMRLAHTTPKVIAATATLLEVSGTEFGEGTIKKYSLEYPTRTLSIYFENEFPFQILGWKEQYDGKTTIAKKKATIKSPYWQKNQKEDRKLRQQLGLESR